MKPLRALLLTCALSAQTPEPRPIERLYVAVKKFTDAHNAWTHQYDPDVISAADKERVRTFRKAFKEEDRALRAAGYD